MSRGGHGGRDGACDTPASVGWQSVPLVPPCFLSSPGACSPIPGKEFLGWGSSEDTQVKGRQEMGWLGAEALTAFSGCNLSHLPSCSEDISHVDPPKDVTETTQETFQRGEQIICPRENIDSCYMEEGAALQAKKEKMPPKAPLRADAVRKQVENDKAQGWQGCGESNTSALL